VTVSLPCHMFTATTPPSNMPRMIDPWAQCQDRVVTFRPDGSGVEVETWDASELSTDIPEEMHIIWLKRRRPVRRGSA
jgi:hypothetical protein